MMAGPTMAARTRRRRPRHRGPAGPHRRQAAIVAAIQGFRRALSGFHRLMSAASEGKVSMADALALQYIVHTGHATPSDLGRFTGLTSGAVTTMLDRLEDAGFIQRRRNAQDRRVVVVSLRPGAHQKVVGMMLEAHQGIGRMFEGWNVAQIEALVGLLERLELDS
jgi:MarR family transcriptional regulator, organic hydroperoxide resistance regulator